MVETSERNLYILMAMLLTAILAAGIVTDGLATTTRDLLVLQTTGVRLIQDFTVTGIGGALVNAAVVALIGLIFVYFTDVRLAGPTIAAIFTMLGFGLFGKTVLNCIPIMAGVAIAARWAGKTVGSYSIIALFGTALGPLVTYIMFELPLSLSFSIPLALVAGLFIGFILPAVASSLLQLHQGYNLYNVGFSCGFIGLFASALFKAMEKMESAAIVWNTTFHPVLTAFIPSFSLVLILSGLSMYRMPIRSTLKDLFRLQQLTGRLPSDFFDVAETGAPLVNMGVLGLASSAFVALVGAPFNGPVLGGMLTVIGFGAFGKTLKNTWPVVVGVCLAVIVFGKDLSAPGPILAALFCTTLAPIAGEFGIIAGMIAGFLHLVMVEVTGAWHGGMDLYNNGFAGGLSASLIISVIRWYQINKTKEDFKS